MRAPLTLRVSACRDWRLEINVQDRKRDRRFLPFETFTNVRLLVFGAEGLTRDWQARRGSSTAYLLPCLFSTSFLESTFGQLKNLAGGKLTGGNFAGMMARHTAIRVYAPATATSLSLTPRAGGK